MGTASASRREDDHLHDARTGYFLASFALGEKAVQAARKSGLPAAVLDAIDHAPKYAEGRGVRFEVRRKQDVASIEELAMLKVASWKK